MLYLFAGFPRNGLNAGGLRLAIEEIEEIGLLVHDPAISYQKEGVFIGGEYDHPVESHMSAALLKAGITWDWFPEKHTFGNGVTCFKSTAIFEDELVESQTGLPWKQFLKEHGAIRLDSVSQEMTPKITAGRQKYENLWLPGTCPTDSHIVHITWVVMGYKLPAFAYERLRVLVEEDEPLGHVEQYRPKEHISEIRPWEHYDSIT